MNPSERRPVHVSVMPREVLQALQLTPGLTVLDGTAGAGGHSALILSKIGPDGFLIAMDRDPMMLEFAAERLKQTVPDQQNYRLEQANYTDAVSLLQKYKFQQLDRVLLDLGLSSDQLADRERGFGFDAGGILDMRYNPEEGAPAAELLQRLGEEALADIFEKHGEEPAARRIAAEIVHRRLINQPVMTTADLEDCVRRAVGNFPSRPGRNPATRVFQALRIETNQELEHVERMMTVVLPQILKPGGIAVVLTFHSLEDRIVKTAFKGQQGWQVLTKTPIEASSAEIRLNPRSRSAKLRAVQRL